MPSTDEDTRASQQQPELVSDHGECSLGSDITGSEGRIRVECSPREQAEQAAAGFDQLYDSPETIAWTAREASRTQAREAAAAIAPPSSPSSIRDRIARMGAAAIARLDADAHTAPATSDSGSSALDRAAVASNIAPPPPPGASPYVYSRLEWHKRELARMQLEQRIEQHQRKKLAARVRDEDNAEAAREAGWEAGPRAGVWSEGRTRKLLQARSAVRARTMEARAARVRELWCELALDPSTSHYAIGIKRICDQRGWTLADPAAQRVLALLDFLRELSIPHCWNAKYVRPIGRRGSNRMAMPTRGSETFEGVTLRKHTPAVRGVGQGFLCTVLAAAGHTREDDRRCCSKTVQRALALLEGVGLVQAVQVPAHAAEAFEIGDSGHTINRYYLADRGSPKPALMACWLLLEDADGGAVLSPAHSDVLELPWIGAANSNAPS